jgi:hypothetical protein
MCTISDTSFTLLSVDKTPVDNSARDEEQRIFFNLTVEALVHLQASLRLQVDRNECVCVCEANLQCVSDDDSRRIIEQDHTSTSTPTPGHLPSLRT